MKGGRMSEDRRRAARWARALLDHDDWVILDTETTGLSRSDEIIQVAVLAGDGRVLLDTYVRPTQPIPAEATRIHGITDQDVSAAPSFPEIHDRLQGLLAGKTVVIYNAEFDLRMLHQTLVRHGLQGWDFSSARVECAMLHYSAWKGELWGDGSYKWQKLEGGDHTARGDCLATLELIKRMAG